MQNYEETSKSQEYVNSCDNEENASNADVMVKQAQDVWKIIQKQPMPTEVLDKLIPANAEFFKGLIDVINKQLDSDDNQYKDYVSLMRASQAIIGEALKDGQISKEERIEIIKVLAELNHNLAEVEINRKKQDGRTKRVFGICGAAFAAIAAIVVDREA